MANNAVSGALRVARDVGGSLNVPVDHPARIGTRLPTGKKPLDVGPGPQIVGMPAFRATPDLFKKNVDVLRAYPNVHQDAAKMGHDELANHFINHVSDNLLWLHDQVPQATRNRSKLWYDGANKLAKEWAQHYGVSEGAAAGAMAALSPQKDWFQNVSLAKRVLDAMKGGGDEFYKGFKFSPEMEQRYRSLEALAKPDNEPLLDAVRGRSLHDIDQHDMPPDERAILKALWIRVHDQTHNAPHYNLVTPEGGFGDLVRNADGSPSKAGWGSLPEIAKAVQSIEHNGDPAIMNRLMGEKHKVRNFYNNILDPNSRHGDVTIDTHAVAAGLLRPLSGNSLEVAHNFANYAGKGMPGVGGSAATGVQGTYPLYADAYRQAAAKRGILPREMQSITWEAIRGMFPDTFKTKKNNAAVDSIWNGYRTGKTGIDDARRQIHDLAGGIRPPDWEHGAGAANAAPQNPGNPAELRRPDVRGRAPQGAIGGAGAGLAGAAAPPTPGPVTRADGGAVDKALQLTNPRRLSPQGFYSAGAEAARSLPQAKGSQNQLLASMKGVKPDEIANAGLQNPQAGATTRDQLASQFEQAMPEMQETVYGDREPSRASGQWWGGAPKYEQYSLPGGKRYRELLMHLPSNPRQSEDYKTSHWSEPNVLAHMRMSEREEPPEMITHPEGYRTQKMGKRGTVLHLEELQSDWRNAARQHGVRGPEPEPDWEDKLIEMRNKRGAKPFADAKQEADFQKLHNYEWSVPTHPYIKGQNSHIDLGLKRMLVEAARGGHGRLAWTPDEIQRERYPEGREDSALYDKVIPNRLKDIVRKLGYEPQFEPHPVKIWGDEDRGEDPDDYRDVNLHSLKLPPELRERILKGVPAFAQGGAIPEGYADGGKVKPTGDWEEAATPQNSVKAYKLFRKKQDGKIYPLYVHADRPIPFGKWLAAEEGQEAKASKTGRRKVKSSLGPLAYRPGWHAGEVPVATHIGGVSSGEAGADPDYRKPDEVWAEVEYPNDVDWQSEANKRAEITKAGHPNLATAHITDQVPHNGFYRYKTNSNMTGNWMISGGMKVNRLLHDDEVKALNARAGLADLPRLHEFSPDVQQAVHTRDPTQARAPGNAGVNSPLVDQALRMTAKPAKTFARGGLVNKETAHAV